MESSRRQLGIVNINTRLFIHYWTRDYVQAIAQNCRQAVKDSSFAQLGGFSQSGRHKNATYFNRWRCRKFITTGYIPGSNRPFYLVHVLHLYCAQLDIQNNKPLFKMQPKLVFTVWGCQRICCLAIMLHSPFVTMQPRTFSKIIMVLLVESSSPCLWAWTS